LVQDGLSSAVHNHGDSGVGLCVAEVSEEKQCVKVRRLGANAGEGTPRKVNR
jgi:ATP-dependent Clp protease adapter protein ClpS